ncbi:unnamed protein product [Vitrella brassicaformis CCMP3155]|uniref:subtilisin n=1 Tax=Vitrella brassicaformis (strain CCMP3155) TaxID=1169540 RepID=A0A0G4FWD8_VITBC|nr:unnamed protein product [Vitrella brassicaformis CCMP3155]|eukprot:CEM19526.1 unnamed protein product [Vitrella brassicaformis CCMP3155]
MRLTLFVVLWFCGSESFEGDSSSIRNDLKRFTKPRIGIDTILVTLHFLAREQRLHGATKGNDVSDPFTDFDSPAQVGVLAGSNFDRWRGLFRSPSKLAEFSRATGTRVTPEGVYVDVTIKQKAGVKTLEATLRALGMRDLVRYERIVSGMLPYDSIGRMLDVEGISIVHAVRTTSRWPMRGHRRDTGDAPRQQRDCSRRVVSQGDRAMGTDVVRRTYNVNGRPLDGRSLKCIGVLSDSHDGGDLKQKCELPRKVEALKNCFFLCAARGTGMMELIYDVVPGLPKFVFHSSARGEASLATGIERLAKETECEVIVDDTSSQSYYEPFFAPGVVEKAIDNVARTSGVSYIAAHGDNADRGFWEPFRSSGLRETVDFTTYEDAIFTYEFHVWSATNSTSLNVTLVENMGGFALDLILQWDQNYKSVGGVGAQTDLDLLVFDKNGELLIAATENNRNNDPIEVISPLFSDTFTDVTIKVGKFIPPLGIDPGPDPGVIALVNPDLGDGTLAQNLSKFAPPSRVVSGFGRVNALGASSVGAAFYNSTPAFGTAPAKVRRSSSRGAFQKSFDAQGRRITPPQARMRPNFIGPDGTKTTDTLLVTRSSANFASDFRGSTAAASHIAGLAGLMLDFDKALRPKEIQQLVMETADDMNDPATAQFDEGFDSKTGAGFVNAERVFQRLSRRPRLGV